MHACPPFPILCCTPKTPAADWRESSRLSTTAKLGFNPAHRTILITKGWKSEIPRKSATAVRLLCQHSSFMVGAILLGASMAGAVAAISLTGTPCRCSSSETVATGVVNARKQGHSFSNIQRRCSTQVQLYSRMTQAWQDSRFSARVLVHMVPCSTSGHHAPMVVDELGGQYEDTFADVEKHLLDYFTYKAVKTVLAQLSEMNPPEYAWFYNFVVNNKPQDSKFFIRALVKERQELGERVMVTRLHLFNKWVKKYNHAQMHKAISDQNLELLRERLIQTVKLTSDGDNIDRPPLRGMD